MNTIAFRLKRILAAPLLLGFMLAPLSAVAQTPPPVAAETTPEAVQTAAPADAASAPEMTEEELQQAEARRRAASEVAAKLAAEELAARKRMRAYQVSERERQRETRELQCVIKPVMSDEEIKKCKEVWR
ncbi:MAG: hypothetical protein KUL75_10995 [Sterolibacterium sp.]|nr:hypothetical protein [Sterolibacterium sp.]